MGMKDNMLLIRRNARFVYLSLRFKLHIMSPLDTIAYIEKHQCSVARYGDGELNMILTDKSIGFQKYDPELAERLKSVLSTQNPKLLLCLPHTLERFLGEKAQARNFWSRFVDYNKPSVYAFLKEKKMDRYMFGDTQMTRPYMDYTGAENAKQVYPALKKLWEGRNILIVEGSATRMGVGNDLFANAASVRRILCPAENAFASYDRILQTVCEHHAGELVLIALGPTATVLAADLTKRGIRALDVGHLDVEYEWFLAGAKEKTSITGKYVNEVEGGRQQQVNDCPEYRKQIAVTIDP